MQEINLTDETYDGYQSKNYFLSLQSSFKGFSYVIIDTVRNKCVVTRNYPCSFDNWDEYSAFLESILKTDSNLGHSFKTVVHTLENPVFSLVPEEYTDSSVETMAAFLPHVSVGSNEKLVSSYMQSAKATAVSIYPSNLTDLLEKRFGNITLLHQANSFVHTLITDSSRLLRHLFHLQLSSNSMLIGVAHMSTLDFVNSFPINSPTDVIYYSLSVLENFKISPQLVEIFVYTTPESADIIDEMKKFIPKIRTLSPPQSMVYSHVMTDETLLNFVNILNTYYCV